MFKPRVAKPRHSNQYLSTKVHVITRASRHIPNMRKRVARLKSRLRK